MMCYVIAQIVAYLCRQVDRLLGSMALGIPQTDCWEVEEEGEEEEEEEEEEEIRQGL